MEIGKHEKRIQLFQLSSVNGQTVLTKELWIDENSRVAIINIPSEITGVCFL
jgi:hypothetical protein